MIRFNYNKLHLEYVLVNSVSMALGGSMNVVDEEESTVKHPVNHRIVIPLAIARTLQQTHGSRFMVPKKAAILWYEVQLCKENY